MYCIVCRTNFNWSEAPVYGMGLGWYQQQKKQLFGIKKKDSLKKKEFQPNLSSPFKRRKDLNEKIRAGHPPPPYDNI